MVAEYVGQSIVLEVAAVNPVVAVGLALAKRY